MFAGCLPLLVQWPLFSVLSLLFRSRRVGGAANTLLTHRLFGTPLASYWLGGAGPVSAQGAVFAGVFVLLAVIAWLSARSTARAAAQAGTGAVLPALTRVLPYATVAVAAFVPLAAALYLITSTAWTLAERMPMQRFLSADRQGGTASPYRRGSASSYGRVTRPDPSPRPGQSAE